MQIFSTISAGIAVSVCALIGATGTLVAESDEATAQRMAALEARLMELESRLAEAEQETKEVKVIAETSMTGIEKSSPLTSVAFDIIAGDAWRNLRWTQEEQWEGIKKGITEELVIEFLGSPPRSVKSLKPRVDEVLYYETSLLDSTTAMRGSISLRNGKVISVKKPNFAKMNTGG